jgi:hypothetical protein
VPATMGEELNGGQWTLSELELNCCRTANLLTKRRLRRYPGAADHNLADLQGGC